MGGSGRSRNSHRKSLKRRDKGCDDRQNNQPNHGKTKIGEIYHFDKNRAAGFDRPRWTPVKLPSDPLPVPDCSLCGKPIKDIAEAVTDRITGAPAHFDCIVSRISESEKMEKGDTIAYMGGGRFGIVYSAAPHDDRRFKVKKIIEWEDKGNRAEWRQIVADHFSLT
ncbi:MAG: hypothetical protein LBU18_04775 [Treponema sp.]|jgi:hypothetical protein|nr:hypothetical protein [Treponema sp.]